MEFNDNEDEFFISIMNAISRKLSGEVPNEIYIDTDIEAEEVVIVKNRALTSKRGELK